MLHLAFHGFRVHARRQRRAAHHALEIFRRHLRHGLRGLLQHVRVARDLLSSLGPLVRAGPGGAAAAAAAGRLPSIGDHVRLGAAGGTVRLRDRRLVDASALQLALQPGELPADGLVAGRQGLGLPDIRKRLAQAALGFSRLATPKVRLEAPRVDLESVLACLHGLVEVLGLQVAQGDVVEEVHLQRVDVPAHMVAQVLERLAILRQRRWVGLLLHFHVALVFQHLRSVVHVLLLRAHLGLGLRHARLHLLRRHVLHLIQRCLCVDIRVVAAAHALHHVFHDLRVHVRGHLSHSLHVLRLHVGHHALRRLHHVGAEHLGKTDQGGHEDHTEE
mmetsp:Transcript_31092/g.88769  ORF Transcript_31092/g.88769 Transcript_31092/m.88769 type:complete len:332 (+) Transcript_31092:770-1765(+)